MRRFTVLVLMGLLLGATVGGVMFGGFLDRGPTWSVLAALPGRVCAVTPHDKALLVAAGKAGLFRVDPETGAVTALFYATGDQEIQDVFVADGKAYTLAHSESLRQYDMYSVDADSGQFIRGFALGSSVTDLPGLQPQRRLIVVEGAQVRVINRDTGQRYQSVVVTGGILGGAYLDRKRLYVSRRFEGGLAIIDMKEPALTEVIETEQWLVDVAVADGKAYVETRKSGLGVIDLETRAFTPMEATDVLVTPAGDVFALESEALRELDPISSSGLRVPLPRDLRAELDGADVSLLSVGEGHALIACGNRLLLLEWPVKDREPDRVARSR
ncbi:MAG: NHL repeat-containing protein [Planctomycetota bacterium]